MVLLNEIENPTKVTIMSLNKKFNIHENLDDLNINFENADAKLKKIHSTNKNDEYYSFKEACCSEGGYHYSCTSSEAGEFSKFGMGIALYFKYLRWLYWFFGLFTILSLPIVYINIQGSVNSGMEP